MFPSRKEMSGLNRRGLLQHSRRKIQTENGCVDIAQVSGDLTGPTAPVTYFASSHNFSGKAIEQFSVKRLVLKFVENSACILVREPIITFTNRLCHVVIHVVSLDGTERAPSNNCAIGLIDELPLEGQFGSSLKPGA